MKVIRGIQNYFDNLGNELKVHKTVKSGSDMTITFMEQNAKIFVAKNTNLTDLEITLGKNSTLMIGSDSTLKGKISIGSYSSVYFGNNISVTKNLYVRVVEATTLKIGNDCLIASDVIIRTCDGHPIYDINTTLRINKGKNIIINDHVWIGDQAVILKGVTIGTGSIIAMRSIVTKNVDEKVIVAGIPAKVVRRNCTWEHTIHEKNNWLYE